MPQSGVRVLIDARSLAERNTSNRTYWSELVRALVQEPGIELILASNAPIGVEDVPPGAEMVIEPAPGRWFSFSVLPRLAREHRADVVHVQYTVSPRFRTPVVTTVHDVSFFIEPKWFGLKDRLLLRKTVPAACRRAAKVIAPSETCREEILAYIDVPPYKVRITLEGTPTRLLGATEEDSMAETAVRTLVKGLPYVLLVGGASPRKNLLGAIEAVRVLRRTVPEMRLFVTGRLDNKPVEEWVVNIGPLPEPILAAAYRGAHALLHPSWHEGFGLTILEAMALGCPVVASDRGSIPEVAGEAARLYDPTDVEGMAGALVELLNPAVRATMMEAGRARAAEFTWEGTAWATVAVYREAIDVG